MAGITRHPGTNTGSHRARTQARLARNRTQTRARTSTGSNPRHARLQPQTGPLAHKPTILAPLLTTAPAQKVKPTVPTTLPTLAQRVSARAMTAQQTAANLSLRAAATATVMMTSATAAAAGPQSQAQAANTFRQAVENSNEMAQQIEFWTSTTGVMTIAAATSVSTVVALVGLVGLGYKAVKAIQNRAPQKQAKQPVKTAEPKVEIPTQTTPDADPATQAGPTYVGPRPTVVSQTSPPVHKAHDPAALRETLAERPTVPDLAPVKLSVKDIATAALKGKASEAAQVVKAHLASGATKTNLTDATSKPLQQAIVRFKQIEKAATKEHKCVQETQARLTEVQDVVDNRPFKKRYALLTQISQASQALRKDLRQIEVDLRSGKLHVLKDAQKKAFFEGLNKLEELTSSFNSESENQNEQDIQAALEELAELDMVKAYKIEKSLEELLEKMDADLENTTNSNKAYDNIANAIADFKRAHRTRADLADAILVDAIYDSTRNLHLSTHLLEEEANSDEIIKIIDELAQRIYDFAGMVDPRTRTIVRQSAAKGPTEIDTQVTVTSALDSYSNIQNKLVMYGTLPTLIINQLRPYSFNLIKRELEGLSEADALNQLHNKLNSIKQILESSPNYDHLNSINVISSLNTLIKQIKDTFLSLTPHLKTTEEIDPTIALDELLEPTRAQDNLRGTDLFGEATKPDSHVIDGFDFDGEEEVVTADIDPDIIESLKPQRARQGDEIKSLIDQLLDEQGLLIPAQYQTALQSLTKSHHSIDSRISIARAILAFFFKEEASDIVSMHSSNKVYKALQSLQTEIENLNQGEEKNFLKGEVSRLISRMQTTFYPGDPVYFMADSGGIEQAVLTTNNNQNSARIPNQSKYIAINKYETIPLYSNANAQEIIGELKDGFKPVRIHDPQERIEAAYSEYLRIDKLIDSAKTSAIQDEEYNYIVKRFNLLLAWRKSNEGNTGSLNREKLAAQREKLLNIRPETVVQKAIDKAKDIILAQETLDQRTITKAARAISQLNGQLQRHGNNHVFVTFVAPSLLEFLRIKNSGIEGKNEQLQVLTDAIAAIFKLDGNLRATNSKLANIIKFYQNPDKELITTQVQDDLDFIKSLKLFREEALQTFHKVLGIDDDKLKTVYQNLVERQQNKIAQLDSWVDYLESLLPQEEAPTEKVEETPSPQATAKEVARLRAEQVIAAAVAEGTMDDTTFTRIPLSPIISEGLDPQQTLEAIAPQPLPKKEEKPKLGLFDRLRARLTGQRKNQAPTIEAPRETAQHTPVAEPALLGNLDRIAKTAARRRRDATAAPQISQPTRAPVARFDWDAELPKPDGAEIIPRVVEPQTQVAPKPVRSRFKALTTETVHFKTPDGNVAFSQTADIKHKNITEAWVRALFSTYSDGDQPKLIYKAETTAEGIQLSKPDGDRGPRLQSIDHESVIPTLRLAYKRFMKDPGVQELIQDDPRKALFLLAQILSNFGNGISVRLDETVSNQANQRSPILIITRRNSRYVIDLCGDIESGNTEYNLIYLENIYSNQPPTMQLAEQITTFEYDGFKITG